MQFVCAWLAVLGLAVATGQPAPGPVGAPAQNTVVRCRLDGTVNAGSADYVRHCVEQAEAMQAEALLFELDTPGGALESTREMVRAMLESQRPVLLWVGPPGARAGSAGVFLVLASHVAAMAPGTNVGAAHPVVGLSGQDPEKAGGEEMARKVENDTVAFAESLARMRGRNVEWAVSAVRESASVDAQRAVELDVVEYLAPTPEAFLREAAGRQVEVAGETQVLQTAEASIVELNPTVKQRALQWLGHPAVAYLLLLGAGLGFMVELASPGTILPGVLGGLCLVLALVAMSALPVRAGAVVLVVAGLALILAEAFVASGFLGVGGGVMLVIGGLLLIDRLDTRWFTEPSFGVPARLVIPTGVLMAVAGFGLARFVAQTRRSKALTGDVGLVGEHGRVVTDVDSQRGEVFVHGERWKAVSNRPVPAGRTVVVRDVRGLTLNVEEEAPA